MAHYYITGGRQRLGLFIVEHLLSQGHDVSCLNRRSSPELNRLQSHYSNLHCYEGDVTNYDWHSLFNNISIDGVIHTASIFTDDDVQSSSVHTRRSMYDIHVHAFNDLVLSWYQNGGAGCAITFLDQKVHHLNPNHLSYTLSKLAAASSVPVLAQAMLGRIRVHGIALGLMLPSGEQSEEDFQRVIQKIPFSAERKESLLSTVDFLLHTSAVTGQIIDVDGGQHLIADRDIIFQ